MRIIERSAWRARNPKTMMTQGAPKEAFLHHSDDSSGRSWLKLVDQCAKMRAIQDFHMDGRGWSDIAYHFLVFQGRAEGKDGRVFEGREYQYVPAAQMGHNTGTLAICVVGNGESETIDRHTRFLIEQILIGFPTVKTLGGHRDVTPTACPGDKFYQSLNQIARAAGLKRYS